MKLGLSGGVIGGPMRKRDSELGRSMIEMLGVLAIVAVLTVGGIAGYKRAILNYRANEVITEAIKRGVSITEQISHGIEKKQPQCDSYSCIIGLGEFKKEPIHGYLFYSDEAEWEGYDAEWYYTIGQFTIWATKDPNNPPSRELCETIKEKSGIDTPVLVTGSCDSDYLEFIFYDDMAMHADYCQNHTVYYDWEENPCGHKAVSGCLRNADCGRGQYCDLSIKSYSPEHGTCKAVDSIPSEEYNIAGIGHLTITTDSLNWFAADNYCKAIGKSLISIDDLGCYLDGKKVVNGSYISSGAVVNPGKRCCNSSSGHLTTNSIGECPHPNWNNLSNNPGYSPAFYAFGKALKGGSFWTRSRVSKSPNSLYSIFCFNILNPSLMGKDYGACSSQSGRRAVCK